MIVAPDFVPVVLGSQWEAAVPVIQILAWVGILQALQSDQRRHPDGPRPHVARCSATRSCSPPRTSSRSSIGLHWGIIGVAVAYAISSTLVEPILTVLTARAIGVSPWVFVRSLTGVAQATAGMAAVVLLARMAMVDAGVPAGARLVLAIAVGAIVFIPLCAWRVPEVRHEVRTVLPRFFREPMPTPTPAES